MSLSPPEIPFFRLQSSRVLARPKGLGSVSLDRFNDLDSDLDTE